MSVSKFMNENENYIEDAINNGIGGPAIESTIGDIVDRTNGRTTKQVKESIETIIDMKETVNEKENQNYSSSLVRNNSEKIKEAINNGISANEVATNLVKNSNNANTKAGKKHLKFIVNLISKFKRKEKKLNYNRENNTKSYQKVLKKD